MIFQSNVLPHNLYWGFRILFNKNFQIYLCRILGVEYKTWRNTETAAQVRRDLGATRRRVPNRREHKQSGEEFERALEHSQAVSISSGLLAQTSRKPRTNKQLARAKVLCQYIC